MMISRETLIRQFVFKYLPWCWSLSSCWSLYTEKKLRLLKHEISRHFLFWWKQVNIGDHSVIILSWLNSVTLFRSYLTRLEIITWATKLHIKMVDMWLYAVTSTRKVWRVSVTMLSSSFVLPSVLYLLLLIDVWCDLDNLCTSWLVSVAMETLSNVINAGDAINYICWVKPQFWCWDDDVIYRIVSCLKFICSDSFKVKAIEVL